MLFIGLGRTTTHAAPIVQSTLEASSSTAKASYAQDGKSYTAWRSEADKAEGEWLSLHFGSTRYIHEVTIYPGHPGNNETWRLHARPAQIRLVWDDGAHETSLKDARHAQKIPLGKMVRTKRLTLQIKSIHGQASGGVAIAEFRAHEPSDILSLDPTLRTKIEGDVGALATNPGAAKKRLIAHGKPAAPWLADWVNQGRAGWGEALDALVAIAPERAVMVVAPLLEDETALRVTLGALIRHPQPGFEALVLSAIERHGAKAFDGLRYLTAVRHPSALSLFDSVIASGARATVKAAAHHLPSYGQAARPMALRWLKGSNEEIKRAALRIVAETNKPSAELIALIEGQLFAEDEENQVLALTALKQLGELDERRDLLSQALLQGSPALRQAALSELLSRGSENTDVLSRALDTSRSLVARSILHQLGQHDSIAVRSFLVGEMARPSGARWYEDLRTALVNHQGKGARAVLEHLVAHPNHGRHFEDYFKHASEWAAQPAGLLLAQLGADRKLDNLKIALFRAVQYGQARAHGSTIVRIYREDTSSIRLKQAALEAMSGLATPEVLDVVLTATENTHPRLAATAFRSAARLGDRRLVPVILSDLSDRRPSRWSAGPIEALGLLRAHESLPALERGFHVAPYEARLAILEACHRMGGQVAIRILVNASISRDAPVARAAREFLREQS